MATQREAESVCKWCGDVISYCKCPYENPLCRTCWNPATECVCPDANEKLLRLQS